MLMLMLMLMLPQLKVKSLSMAPGLHVACAHTAGDRVYTWPFRDGYLGAYHALDSSTP
jgi:hypothetical protein